MEGGGEGAEEEPDNADSQLWWKCDCCQKGIPGGKKRFDCTVCENYTLCVNCFRIRRHPHKFVRRRVPDHNMPPESLRDQSADPKEMEEALDEYFQLDYEDIIGGDLPTRFKYRNVQPNDYGLAPHEVLSKTDQELNRLMPLKKLRTYREDSNAAEPQRPYGNKPAENSWRPTGKNAPVDRSRVWKGQKKPDHATNGISAERLEAYNLQMDQRPKKRKQRE